MGDRFHVAVDLFGLLFVFLFHLVLAESELFLDLLFLGVPVVLSTDHKDFLFFGLFVLVLVKLDLGPVLIAFPV